MVLSMNIVLHEPGIALNTGNIGRTCAATDTALHLIRPYGFRITEKEIKRAGMDYWEKIRLTEYIDYEDFLEKHPELCFDGEAQEDAAGAEGSGAETGCRNETGGRNEAGARDEANGRGEAGAAQRLWFATTKAHRCYTDVSFGPEDYIMLGNESRGIPEEILVKHPDACIRIPMWGEIRSLNLANSAAIILYEALRQNHFEKMQLRGELHRLSWETGEAPGGPA